MFNRPNPARATKVWHPNLGVLADDTVRGFTSSRWQGGEAQGFASDTFGSHDSGFIRDDHPVSHDALSESAQRAFSLLDDVKKQHALAKKALEEQEAASANAHLPFVLDVYEAPEPKRVVAAEPVAPSTLTEAVDAPETQANDAAHTEGDADEHAALTDAETVASELPKVADAAASFEETQDESAQA